MKKSTIAALCAVVPLLIGGAVSAAETPQPQARQMLPQLYVAASLAQAACPTDQVVWVNWEARMSHLPNDVWYGKTTSGAYACAEAAVAAEIKPAN